MDILFQQQGGVVSPAKLMAGSILLVVFGILALLGTLLAGTSYFINGPLKSSMSITHREMANSQMTIASRIAIFKATTTSGNGDCDTDGFVEPLPWREPVINEKPPPEGGGYFPDDIATRKTDPFGTLYGYCVWDGGPKVDDVGCGGATQQRLRGAPTETHSSVAVISAGPDKIFQTICNDYTDTSPADGKPDESLIVSANNSDDMIVHHTYEQAIASSSGLWILKSDEMETATIGNKNIEVGGSAHFMAQLNTSYITARNSVIEVNNALRFPNQSLVPICKEELVGAMRYNSTKNALELCKLITSPSTYGFVNQGGAAWPLLAPDGTEATPSYGFENFSGAGIVLSTNAQTFVSASNTAVISNSAGSENFRLKVKGGVQFSNDSGVCVNELAGTIRYVAADRKYQFCNGASWSDLGGDDTDTGCFEGSALFTTVGLSTFEQPANREACIYTITLKGGAGRTRESAGGKGGTTIFKFKSSGDKSFIIAIGGGESNGAGGHAAGISYDEILLAVAGGGGDSGYDGYGGGAEGGAGGALNNGGSAVASFYGGNGGSGNNGGFGGTSSSSGAGNGGSNGSDGDGFNDGGNTEGGVGAIQRGLGGGGSGLPLYKISGGGAGGGGAGYGGGGGGLYSGSGGGGGGYINLAQTTDRSGTNGSNASVASVAINWGPGDCNLPWGGTAGLNTSVTAYQEALVPYGSTCTSQLRTCTGGVLSGDYTHQSCEVETLCEAGYQAWATPGTYTFAVPSSGANCSKFRVRAWGAGGGQGVNGGKGGHGGKGGYAESTATQTGQTIVIVVGGGGLSPVYTGGQIEQTAGGYPDGGKGGNSSPWGSGYYSSGGGGGSSTIYNSSSADVTKILASAGGGGGGVAGGGTGPHGLDGGDTTRLRAVNGGQDSLQWGGGGGGFPGGLQGSGNGHEGHAGCCGGGGGANIGDITSAGGGSSGAASGDPKGVDGGVVVEWLD